MNSLLSFLLILSVGPVLAQEDSGKGLTCKQLTNSSEILKCSDGKYYAPTGEVISYQDNKDVLESKRDSKARTEEGYQQRQDFYSSSSNTSK